MRGALSLVVLTAAAAGPHSLAADPLDNLSIYLLVGSEGKRTGDPVWAWFGDLNGEGLIDHRDAARALENLLSGAAGTLEKVPPVPDFDWPYYLYLPLSVPPGTCTRLLVAPNNTGTGSDDQAVHDQAARSQAEGLSIPADRLRTPLLVPTFPRPLSNWQVYTHVLDRDSLLTTLPGLRRLDLQLIAMIEHAGTRLQAAMPEALPLIGAVALRWAAWVASYLVGCIPAHVAAEAAGNLVIAVRIRCGARELSRGASVERVVAPLPFPTRRRRGTSLSRRPRPASVPFPSLARTLRYFAASGGPLSSHRSSQRAKATGSPPPPPSGPSTRANTTTYRSWPTATSAPCAPV